MVTILFAYHNEDLCGAHLRCGGNESDSLCCHAQYVVARASSQSHLMRLLADGTDIKAVNIYGSNQIRITQRPPG